MEESEPKVDLTLKLEAFFGAFARWITNDIEALHERMDKLELSQTLSKGRRDKINMEESESPNDEEIEHRPRPRRREPN